jgi:hypothetical protein
MTFLLSEDKALREMLQGITVHDQRAGQDDLPRQVGVWFGQPDQELRNQSYPYITIDMIDINRDPAREMRGFVSPDYLQPTGLANNKRFEIPVPIPVTIDYQITTYARQPRHDRELITTILYERLPFRFGGLSILENSTVSGSTTTNTYTTRRLDVLDVSKRDVTEQAKRLFVNSITVRISSEIVQETYRELYKILAVNIQDPTTANSGNRPGDPDFVGTWAQTITE